MVVVSSVTLAYNVFGLGEGGDFHHPSADGLMRITKL